VDPFWAICGRLRGRGTLLKQTWKESQESACLIPVSLRVQGATSDSEAARMQASSTTSIPRHRSQRASSQRVDKPGRGVLAAGGNRARRYRGQPNHTPAVLISREKIPQLPFEPCAFLLIYGADTSYTFGGTNTQSSELAARIS